MTLEPGVTYSNHQPTYSWGAQTIATLRLDENDNDYSLGDRIMMTALVCPPLRKIFQLVSSWCL